MKHLVLLSAATTAVLAAGAANADGAVGPPAASVVAPAPAPAQGPLQTPAMTAPLLANPNPFAVDAGFLGPVVI
jgi:hypothetical protein